jgi:hypothetical protein
MITPVASQISEPPSFLCAVALIPEPLSAPPPSTTLHRHLHHLHINHLFIEETEDTERQKTLKIQMILRDRRER